MENCESKILEPVPAKPAVIAFAASYWFEKKIPKELTLKVMSVSDEISLDGTSAPTEFLHEKQKERQKQRKISIDMPEMLQMQALAEFCRNNFTLYCEDIRWGLDQFDS